MANYSTDYNFLMDFSAASGNSTYKTFALAAWTWQKANVANFADGNQNLLWNHYAGIVDMGYAAWETADWGLAVLRMGDIVWSNHMADEINNHLGAMTAEPPGLNNYPELGFGSALGFFVTSPYASATYSARITLMKTTLEARQNLDGSWSQNAYEDVQTTSYVVMGLWTAGEKIAAQKGADWILNQQYANGGFKQSNGDGTYDEYSEVDSEAMSALAMPNLLAMWYSGDPPNIFTPKSKADLNTDGVVDIADLAAIAKVYGARA